jgi:hypothetical protein
VDNPRAIVRSNKDFIKKETLKTEKTIRARRVKDTPNVIR